MAEKLAFGLALLQGWPFWPLFIGCAFWWHFTCGEPGDLDFWQSDHWFPSYRGEPWRRSTLYIKLKIILAKFESDSYLILFPLLYNNGNLILDADLSKTSSFMANKKHPGLILKEGHFGFAGHNDPVSFKNIKIKRIWFPIGRSQVLAYQAKILNLHPSLDIKS